MAYPDGNAVYYDYSRGAVTGVRVHIAGSAVGGVSSVTYRPMDLAMSGWTSPNGLTNTIGYDSDLRPTAISVPNVQNLAFTRDAADRITHITNGMNGSYTQSLAYDGLDRLTSMTSGARNESYQYDAVGNRTRQVIDGAATDFTYAVSSNRLASASGGISATYGYNAYGNTTTVSGLATYTYDPFGRLANAGGTIFEISAEGQRLRKAFGGNVTYFVPGAGGALLAENANGAWKDYVWLNGRLVAMIAGGAVYSVHADQTGRAMAVTAPNQSVAWASRNDPFDRSTVTGTAAFFPLGFPGQYLDAEDGLWHNGFRDYDPETGRYIQSDPIGLGGGVNTYAYVGNDPISNIDPLGLCEQKKCTAARAFLASLGRQLSSAGGTTTWAGIGVVAASGVSAIFAPEAAPAEIGGAEVGAGFIEVGSVASTMGSTLTGYARGGLAQGSLAGVSSLATDKLSNMLVGGAFHGIDESARAAMSSVLGQIPDALKNEEAACNGD